MSSEPDAFDWTRLAEAAIGTLEIAEQMDEPFRSAAIGGIEEMWFRLCGKHIDWDGVKSQLARG